MSAADVKSLLERAMKSPIEKLASADITKLNTLLRTTIRKVERILEKESLLKIHNAIPEEDYEFFKSLEKVEYKSIKDRGRAAIRAYEQYRSLIPEIRATLKAIRSGEPERLIGLSRLQLNRLSLIANVSDENGKLVKYSARNRGVWLAGLGVKVSGFERAGRHSSHKNPLAAGDRTTSLHHEPKSQ